MSRLQLQWRTFAFALPQPLRTARGMLTQKRGWLLRLQAADGRVGWGEAAPLELDGPEAWEACRACLANLRGELVRRELELLLTRPSTPPCLAFAVGAALAELDGLIPPEGWLPAPPSAALLPAGAAMPEALDRLLRQRSSPLLWVKWKVAACCDHQERELLELLLQRLPAAARLRLDANGGWDRSTALAWAERLADEPRLEWLEQPLDPADQAGLEWLAAQVPVALDESLQRCPQLQATWPSWQVRRPSQEGDPRPLLAALQAGQPRLMLSTAFETGMGRRWLQHLAALQAQGPTPTAPGLAPGWSPPGPLFAADPLAVWSGCLTDQGALGGSGARTSGSNPASRLKRWSAC